MNWYVRLRSEDENEMLIEYSYPTAENGYNDTCDGLLKYDKKTKTISIEKMSVGANEGYTKLLFCSLHGVVRKGEITEKKQRICIG